VGEAGFRNIIDQQSCFIYQKANPYVLINFRSTKKLSENTKNMHQYLTIKMWGSFL